VSWLRPSGTRSTRIASEAVRNAFRHSHAAQIEVEIRYDPGQLRLRVRDDGKGIDRKFSPVADAPGTTACWACTNAPNLWGVSWRCGVNSSLVRRPS